MPVEMVQQFDKARSWMPPRWVALGMPHQQETLVPTQENLKRLCLSSGLGKPRYPPKWAGEDGWGWGGWWGLCLNLSLLTRTWISGRKWMEGLEKVRLKKKNNNKDTDQFPWTGPAWNTFIVSQNTFQYITLTKEIHKLVNWWLQWTTKVI